MTYRVFRFIDWEIVADSLRFMDGETLADSLLEELIGSDSI